MPVIAAKYYYLTLALLGVCSLIGLIVAYRFQRDVDDLAPTTEKDLLGPLEKAYASGLMDEAEFRRIQESMRRRKEPESGGSKATARPRPAVESEPPASDEGPEAGPGDVEG